MREEIGEESTVKVWCDTYNWWNEELMGEIWFPLSICYFPDRPLLSLGMKEIKGDERACIIENKGIDWPYPFSYTKYNLSFWISPRTFGQILEDIRVSMEIENNLGVFWSFSLSRIIETSPGALPLHMHSFFPWSTLMTDNFLMAYIPKRLTGTMRHNNRLKLNILLSHLWKHRK